MLTWGAKKAVSSSKKSLQLWTTLLVNEQTAAWNKIQNIINLATILPLSIKLPNTAFYRNLSSYPHRIKVR